jgi:hypothetical protein
MSVFEVNGWYEKHDGGWSSRVPVDEIAVQGQAMRRALFGVKLCRKNVVPGDGARKKSAIVGFSGNMRCIFRFGL